MPLKYNLQRLLLAEYWFVLAIALVLQEGLF